MDQDNKGSGGYKLDQRRLLSGILIQISKNRAKKHICSCKNFRNFECGSKRINSKRCCRICSKGGYNERFLQHVFSGIQKNTGDLRPVINLKPLNRYLRKQHCKMNTLKTVINLVKQGDWAIYLDLKEANMHISIKKKSQKVFQVPGERQSMSTVQRSTLWSNISTQSVYKGSFCGSRIHEINEHSTNSILGRLVYCEPKQKSVRSIDSAKAYCQTVNRPHNPVTVHNISKWIVNTIQMAYDSKKRIKAHSTRAIGPSWDLFKGVSLKSILDSADWKRKL
ncbi:unnamed protein product [Mytilus coruscus]|uniref:Reverse transcriptase domain-containing protein n=1 Tax=Mytilus coruscus TaxID=42192 RepID=A0A6J8AHZ2_MYTCO|nr:unnamed protein product [Mytilus coruscus]